MRFLLRSCAGFPLVPPAVKPVHRTQKSCRVRESSFASSTIS
jgi:hypothetical protein